MRTFTRGLSRALALVVCLCAALCGAAGAKDVTIRFGTLPVLQALPLFVAQEKALFEKSGVKVDIIPFNTAADKDIALSTGSIDGCFADLVTPLVLKGNGRDIAIAATNYDTRKDRRMFAILGKPGGSLKSAADLAGVAVAISSNTVIDFVTERLLSAAGVPADRMSFVETKNIGIRLQLLLSGQVEAATLPEPLVTAAAGRGAVILADDTGLGASQTVLVFSVPFMKAGPEEVKGFFKALGEAGKLINTQPDAQRPLMVTHCRLPEVLQATYPVPAFPDLHAPDKESVEQVARWLKQRGVTSTVLTYEQVVDARLLP